MVGYLRYAFRCIFGPKDFVGNETHIANAYDRAEFVWLCFSKDALDFEMINTKIALSGMVLS